MEKNRPVIFYKQIENNISNQEVFQYSYLKDFLNRQVQYSEEVKCSVHQFQTKLMENTNIYERQLKTIFDQHELFVNKLHHNFSEQKMTMTEVQSRIENLEDKYERILTNIEKEKVLLEAILEQQVLHDKLLKEVVNRTKEEEQIFAELKKHDEHIKDFANKLSLQEVYHETVMERLDSHEGLLNKLLTELDHVKQIIYERSTYLLEKIEKGFLKVAQPIHKFFVHGGKKDEKIIAEEEK